MHLPSVLWCCQLGGRKGIWPVKNLSGGALAWVSVWSEVQTCVWPSWCHCHSLSLASVKSRLVLPFWYRLTRVVPEKGPLNGCVCVCVWFNVCSILVCVPRCGRESCQCRCVSFHLFDSPRHHHSVKTDAVQFQKSPLIAARHWHMSKHSIQSILACASLGTRGTQVCDCPLTGVVI